MKLDKYVKIVGTTSLLIGIAVLAISIYELVHVNSLTHDTPSLGLKPKRTEWMVTSSLGILIGILQVLLSGLMFKADTGHSDLKTPFMFLIGEICLACGGLIVFIMALVFKMNSSPVNGEAFVGIVGLSWISILLALGCLVYKMSTSKIFRVAGRSMT